jgi:hypothetical protein
VPRLIITDRLRSYGAAHGQAMPSVEHRSSKYLNNRAENSHSWTSPPRGSAWEPSPTTRSPAATSRPTPTAPGSPPRSRRRAAACCALYTVAARASPTPCWSASTAPTSGSSSRHHAGAPPRSPYPPVRRWPV